MKQSFILLFLVLAFFTSFAQKEANIWYFGNRAGLDFSNDLPSALLNGEMVSEEGCAVISEKNTGELLFYTNGRNIWNREHTLFPNGRDFQENCSSYVTQSALIVPVPNTATQYYVFSITKSGGTIDNCLGYHFDTNYQCEIRYSLIDMNLDQGRGDVVMGSKNILLQTNATEKLTATPHSNGKDYWLISHAWNSDAFHVYLLTAEGITLSNITTIGSTHEFKPTPNGVFFSDEIRGYLKLSPDGKKLACAVASLMDRPFDLFDFNPSTGLISNYVNLGDLRYQYGVCFSPDNSKLYVTTDSPRNQAYKDVIRQYDLKAGDIEAIIASAQSIIRDNPLTNITETYKDYYPVLSDPALQIGPDGKIYCAGSIYNNLIVISKPNLKGFSCEVNYQSIDFKESSIRFGLPNFIDAYFNNLQPKDSLDTICNEQSIAIFPNPANDFIQITGEDQCSEIYSVMIINSIGQTIRFNTRIANSQSDKIDIRDLPSGLYTIIIKFTSSHPIPKKFIKINRS
ncbi:T9SS type A sorting domain-containing protein [Rhodocytophaga aerolata]|uniref:T9SS type A sorting domain-containing protein n=1 Tax=Rhodocytophaga aerolata TaxID=455078 RepID=A0ABT8RHB8_9BACT|nr:T9SS type A sorting domain-containing protein [Rhodocytophaga aerolata]MDO1451502.1 T9SS type A sorting domain-containing protein [Rhodocytophaga aerolata]